jgi:hypothetical protein
MYGYGFGCVAHHRFSSVAASTLLSIVSWATVHELKRRGRLAGTVRRALSGNFDLLADKHFANPHIMSTLGGQHLFVAGARLTPTHHHIFI